MVGKWLEIYVFIIAALISILPIIIFVNTQPVVVAVCLVTSIGLFIAGIIPISKH